MPPSIDTVQSWQGRTMVDPAGDKLGTIDAIYLDDETGQPEWATVTRGLFSAKAEERAPQLKQQAQQATQTIDYDDGNGAAVAYADSATQDFAAERTSRLRRDR